jgi:predicted O-methyltransferase YrrM
MNLQTISEAAALAGKQIDLTGCDYGPHRLSGRYLKAQPYYRFLAGFVRTLGIGKILEIGTSYGGSIMAMNRGCGGDLPGAQLVTVDKVDIAGEGVASLTHIKRVHGDSLAPETLRQVKEHLTGPIDLIYVDSKHSYEHTKGNVEIYATEFRPRFVILDDIRLNEEMVRYWSEAQERFQEFAYDASEVANRPDGFGVLDYGGYSVSRAGKG